MKGNLWLGLILVLCTSCSSSKERWFVHFKDGSEFAIEKPDFVYNGEDKKCASPEFSIAPYAEMSSYYMKEKYIGRDGYTLRRFKDGRSGLEYYRLCEEVK
jgi:hypothetical protein